MERYPHLAGPDSRPRTVRAIMTVPLMTVLSGQPSEALV
jgi:hypothetical protein